MDWLWGSTSPTPDNSGSDKHTDIEGQPNGHYEQSHLELLGGEDHTAPQTGVHPPIFMLDQMKLTGVPLKSQMSPYLQIDPSIFRESQPQIILPEGYESGRGKFEFYSGYIGCAVAGAYLTGSLRGAFGEFGNEQTKKLLSNTRNWNSSRPWITRVLNAATKHGGGYAQTVGTAIFVYCVSELAIKHLRTEVLGHGDDLLNSFGGATLAGLIYRLPHGIKSGGKGAACGFGLMAAWTLIDGDSRRSLMELKKGLMR